MISKKQSFKFLRLIICLVIAIAASSMFFTVEPMASENANAPVMDIQQEEEAVEAHLLRAYSTGIPATPLRVALQPLNVAQTTDSAAIQAALDSLPETEEVEKETEEEVYEETIEEAEGEIYEEPIYEEEFDVVYEEESSETETEIEIEEEPEAEEENKEESAPEASAPGTYSDLDYLAAICQIEAGYNYEGCLAVANVILNRVNSGFGSSIYEVIYTPYQFATGWMDYYLENGTSSAARDAAAAALAGSNNIGGYLYFNGTTWLNPETLNCPYVVIGGNVFY